MFPTLRQWETTMAGDSKPEDGVEKKKRKWRNNGGKNENSAREEAKKARRHSGGRGSGWGLGRCFHDKELG